jgi:hypothetical protein
VGYVKGPKAEGHFSDTALVSIFPFLLQTHAFESDVDTDYLRFLAEGRKRLPVARGAELRLRAGLGVGRGGLTAETRDMTTGAGTRNSWRSTGFTWEIAPGVAFTGERLALEVSLAYAQFPKIRVDDQHFDWNPFGLRAALEF